MTNILELSCYIMYVPISHQCILAVPMALMMSGISYGLTLLQGPLALNPALAEWMQLVCHYSHSTLHAMYSLLECAVHDSYIDHRHIAFCTTTLHVHI